MAVSARKRLNNDKYNAKCHANKPETVDTGSKCIKPRQKRPGKAIQGYILQGRAGTYGKEGQPLTLDDLPGLIPRAAIP